MDDSYDTARLILDEKPVLNYAYRVGQFLAHPVKGRSLDQLHQDYSELSAGVEGKTKESLTSSYFVGWSRHDADEMLGAVSRLDDVKLQKTIYSRLLATNTDKIMNRMLARHGEQDYETMMSSIAAHRLTPEQKRRFLKENRHEPASLEMETRTDAQNIIITESRIEMPVFSVRKIANIGTAVKVTSTVVIPRR
ncbi:MAG: hypothetical protein AB8F34_10950 [Akkermansiaceae bacterium]